MCSVGNDRNCCTVGSTLPESEALTLSSNSVVLALY